MNWISRSWHRLRAKGERPESESEFAEVAIGSIAPVVSARPNGGLPRFQSVASDTLPIGRADGPRTARLRLRNAFTPAQPVSNLRMFAGRSETLLTLIRSIEDQQLHVVLYGDRGMGKTSLLHMLASLAQEARYIVRYTSCSESSEFSDTFRAIASDIPLLFHDDFGPTSEEAEAQGVIADVMPDTTLSVAQVSEAFAKITGTRVLLIMDEFDRSHSTEFRRSIAELIKTLSDRASRVQLVIAGVAPNLTELIEHIPSIRRNIVGIHVGKMAPHEVDQILRIGEEVSGLQFNHGARGQILHAANGSPYLASLLGQHACIIALDRGAVTVEEGDVAFAVERSIEEVRQRVSPRSLRLVDTATENGDVEPLTILARAALDHCGRIDTGALSLPEIDATTWQEMSRRDEVRTLVEPIADDPLGGYRFREETVPLYLWLLDVQRSMADPEAAANRVAMTS